MTFLRTIPGLPVRNIDAAIAFYRDRLGMDIGYHDRSFAIVTRDQVEVHLWAASDAGWERRPPGSPPVVSGAETFIAGTAGCRIEVRDIDALYAAYRESRVLYGPDTVVETTPWGTREFPALDLERNLLTFFERAAT